jgi:hypothetical protein
MKKITRRIISTILVLVLVLSFNIVGLSSFAASAKTPTVASLSGVKIVLKEGQSITYNKDEDVMEQELFNTVVDQENSTLPEGTTYDKLDYTFWLDRNVGEKTVTIKYKGIKYLDSVASTKVTITKATMKVDVPFFKSVYCDEKLTDYVTVTPEDDDIYTYTIFAGINTSADIGLYVDLPEQISSVISNETIGTIWSGLDEKGYTLEERLAEGMTVKQFKEFLSNETLLNALKLLGVDTSGFEAVLNILNSDLVSTVIDDSRIAIGTPNRAGAYAVVALGTGSNYENAQDYGTLVVKKRWGATLQWKDNDPTKGAVVMYNGTAGHVQDGVKVIYSGLTSANKPYISTTAPTEAGKYVATAFLVGGNYMALPLVQSFTI